MTISDRKEKTAVNFDTVDITEILKYECKKTFMFFLPRAVVIKSIEVFSYINTTCWIITESQLRRLNSLRYKIHVEDDISINFLNLY